MFNLINYLINRYFIFYFIKQFEESHFIEFVFLKMWTSKFIFINLMFFLNIFLFFQNMIFYWIPIYFFDLIFVKIIVSSSRLYKTPYYNVHNVLFHWLSTDKNYRKNLNLQIINMILNNKTFFETLNQYWKSWISSQWKYKVETSKFLGKKKLYKMVILNILAKKFKTIFSSDFYWNILIDWNIKRLYSISIVNLLEIQNPIILVTSTVMYSRR